MLLIIKMTQKHIRALIYIKYKASQHLLGQTNHIFSLWVLSYFVVTFLARAEDPSQENLVVYPSKKFYPVPGSEIVVKRRSVKRNAKNARGLGRDCHRPLCQVARVLFLIRPHYTI